MTAGTGQDTSRTLRIDPHVHTVASYDGHALPEDLVQSALASDLDGIVVTDHDTVRGAHIVADIASDTALVVIVGCEVSTADGHLLAIGVDEPPETGCPLPETARRVRNRGGVAVVPHPFQRSRHGASASAIDCVDGIEVYNAHTLVSYRNRQAERFADENGYPSFGGSDAHRPGHVGLAVTEVTVPPDAPRSADAVLGAMRTGRTDVSGHRTTTWQYLNKFVFNAKYKTASVF